MCNRCGKCCQRGNYWQWSKHPRIGEIAGKYFPQEDDCTCDMYAVINEQPTCLIELLLGKEWKPDVCKEYDCEKVE